MAETKKGTAQSPRKTKKQLQKETEKSPFGYRKHIGNNVTLHLVDKTKITGKLLWPDTFELYLDVKGKILTVFKHAIKYVDQYGDRETADTKWVEEPNKLYGFERKVDHTVTVHLMDKTKITGTLLKAGRYEIFLDVDGNEITVFKHVIKFVI